MELILSHHYLIQAVPGTGLCVDSGALVW